MKTEKYFSMKSHYKNLFELNGKTAIVTGAVGILGQRFCRGLAEFGAQVAVVDLDSDRCTAFAAELDARLWQLGTWVRLRCVGSRLGHEYG